MAKAPKTPDLQPAVDKPDRVPAAVFEIPPGLRESSLGLSCNRLINPWAMDRVLSHLGAHSVDIIDSIAVAPDGAYAELVRDGDTLQLFDRL